MSVVGISTTYSTDMMCFLLFLILKVLLEKCDLLLIPIHKRKSHWCLGVACVHDMSTVYCIRSKVELNT